MQVNDILALWRRTKADGQQAVLATVVRTHGSSYRLPGARLLLTRLGERAGSISGGCLEDDLAKKAWWLSENGPSLRTYDTNLDNDSGVSFGLGCNGQIDVLLERLKPKEPNALDELEQVQATRVSRTHRHVVDGEEIFAETLTPPIRLQVFGAGEDAIPLVRMAKLLGWEVWVIDGRAHYLRADRFPHADKLLRREFSEKVPVDAWTVAVLMTHSYSQDLDILKTLTQAMPSYVGLLGPRKRSGQLLEEAGLPELASSSVLHSPMGLDIGADGPEQVALSVLAEIQGVLNQRHGGPLRDRAGSIHARTEEGSATEWARSIVCT